MSDSLVISLKKYNPRKVDGIGGRLATQQVFPVTWNVDRMYYELYLEVLKFNNVKFSEKPVVIINKGRTERHIVVVAKENINKYIQDTENVIRRDGENEWYIKLFGVSAMWDVVKSDWATNPAKWRK